MKSRSRPFLASRFAALVAAGVAAAVLAPALAATPLAKLRISSDVSIQLGPILLDDEAVGEHDLGAGYATLGPIGLPPETDVDAYDRLPGGEHLLSFDTTVRLSTGLVARPADVVRSGPGTESLAFDSAALGIPAGINVDAVAISGSSLLLSFDDRVDLGVLQAEDEDLVLYSTVSGTFSTYFDGSAAGIAASLDLDAADLLECNQHLLLSFDGSGSVAGISFDDEDVLELDPSNGIWELAYDASAFDPQWAAADLDALDADVDPGPGPAIVFGLTVVASADKQHFQWPSTVAFKAVRGSFVSSAQIGSYTVNLSQSGNGASIADPAIPTRGFWYLLKRSSCALTSWQSTLGAEPGRDAAIP